MELVYREALRTDIPQIQEVRHSVKENVLSDPSKVTDEDCRIYIEDRGKGWVCTSGELITAFAIADLQEQNIWALFTRPAWEGSGIGSTLHNIMLNWYFSHHDAVWLSTGKDTKAARFYRKRGWKDAGPYGTDELKFILDKATWQRFAQANADA